MPTDCRHTLLGCVKVKLLNHQWLVYSYTHILILASDTDSTVDLKWWRHPVIWYSAHHQTAPTNQPTYSYCWSVCWNLIHWCIVNLCFVIKAANDWHARVAMCNCFQVAMHRNCHLFSLNFYRSFLYVSCTQKLSMFCWHPCAGDWLYCLFTLKIKRSVNNIYSHLIKIVFFLHEDCIL